MYNRFKIYNLFEFLDEYIKSFEELGFNKKHRIFTDQEINIIRSFNKKN